MTRRRASVAAQKAARQFVCLVVPITLDDYVDLIDPVDRSHDEIQAAFATLESAVRRSEGLDAKDISKCEQDVENAAPKRYQPAIRRALNRLSDAESASRTVREQCAYLIGREIGRRTR